MSNLEGEVGVLVHTKDLRVVYERKVLYVPVIVTQSVCLGGKVDT